MDKCANCGHAETAHSKLSGFCEVSGCYCTEFEPEADDEGEPDEPESD